MKTLREYLSTLADLDGIFKRDMVAASTVNAPTYHRNGNKPLKTRGRRDASLRSRSNRRKGARKAANQ